MLFNSISFAIFLPIIYVLHWFFAKNKYHKNILLLFASYYFYSCWDFRFLFLLIFSTGLDYITGIKIHSAKHTQQKKIWFWMSVIINLGFLGVFKYYNFFAETMLAAMRDLGIDSDIRTLNIILPVGISFYTFHGLSYVIDIYYDRIEPEKNFIVYSLFVSFFPLLVAGPIERATHLLPQLKKDRTFSYERSIDGLRQILWGLFKKMVIADTCAQYVNLIFGNNESYSASTLVLGAFLFAFQIYGDFSGYSDIALGTARLFGVDLLKNFSYPYFSRDIAEFWRRWHISLSTWFRDYLYIPLGGSRESTLTKIRNTFIIFLVSGFWHGANWTFIFWGALHAFYFIPLLIYNKNRANLDIPAAGQMFPTIREFLAISSTFTLTAFAWIFFRADNLNHAFTYIGQLFSSSLFNLPEILPKRIIGLIAVFVVLEWMGRENNFALEKLAMNQPRFLRLSIYYSIILAIFLWGGLEQKFIYFQF